VFNSDELSLTESNLIRMNCVCKESNYNIASLARTIAIRYRGLAERNFDPIYLLSGGRHGSDSAVGSSATLSGDQAPSSPPSWASSPPASPDSAVTAVSYIPDQQAVLQRVSFTTSSEVRQVNRSAAGQQEASRSAVAPYTPSITSIGGAVLR